MEQKFKILTYQEFRDEHLNDTAEKMAYANYVGNVHAANVIHSIQELYITGIKNQASVNENLITLYKVLDKKAELAETALIAHKAKIQFLDQVAWISVILHFLTALCIVLHLLKGSK